MLSYSEGVHSVSAKACYLCYLFSFYTAYHVEYFCKSNFSKYPISLDNIIDVTFKTVASLFALHIYTT